MEKGRARRFQPATAACEQSWNVVELTTRKQVRQKVQELLLQCSDTSMTTSDLRQALQQGLTASGNDFALQLVRALQRDDEEERQSIVWLLTVLNAPETILPLQQTAANTGLPRAIRLSASLALAGMGVTAETIKQHRRIHLYAIS
ncbi:MAG TPA: hypothetical protein VHD63_15695 [Ktedonobacteraceae bacterium]|nr:hypothetical protein [Ktedonobacteraceae bacterium]